MRNHVFFQLGFRPFFLFASLFAIALLSLWILHLTALLPLTTLQNPIAWHAHEMIFGFSTAVISGFILTASRNWTGRPAVAGTPLILLTLTWLLPRVLSPVLGLTHPLVVLTNLLFFPFLIYLLCPFLCTKAQQRNWKVMAVFVLFAIAEGLFYISQFNIAPISYRVGIFIGLFSVLLLISIIGGRILPFFTKSALPSSKAKISNTIEQLSFISLWVLLPFYAFDLEYMKIIAGLTCLIHLIRWLGWHPLQTSRVPLLWSLHLSYFWILIGLLFIAIPEIPPHLALHALTIGGIGGFVYAMMTRVALGHTGRPLQAPKQIVFGYILINLSVIIRVFGPLVGLNYARSLDISGSCWLLAFILFVIYYAPILIRPRPDGRPG